MNVPRSAVEADHKLEGAHDRASEKLAEHRWHWTLDESNAERVTMTEYAKAIGRSMATVKRYAKGWALYQQRMAAAPRGAAFSIQDAIRLSEQTEEMQEFTEIIAEETGRPIAQVARGDNRHRMHEVVGHARDRAERYGTDVKDEVRTIARNSRATGEMRARHREESRQKHSLRWVECDGAISKAKQALRHAMTIANDVHFTDDELELLRHSIEEVELLSKLVGQRLQGIDVNWDAEIEKLRGDQ